MGLFVGCGFECSERERPVGCGFVLPPPDAPALDTVKMGYSTFTFFPLEQNLPAKGELELLLFIH